MALFRYLHDDAFLVFSRAHKHLYAVCLLDLHERFFTVAPAFPTPQQVVHAIYDVMRANPALWNETDDFGEVLPEMVSAGRRRIRANPDRERDVDCARRAGRSNHGDRAWPDSGRTGESCSVPREIPDRRADGIISRSALFVQRLQAVIGSRADGVEKGTGYTFRLYRPGCGKFGTDIC